MNDIKQGKILIIYNTCQNQFKNHNKEPSSQIDYWIKCIKSILDQNYNNHTIIISGCNIKPETKIILQNTFGKKICYNFIDILYPLAITFNKSVEIMINHYGEYDGYIYMDSGTNLVGHPNALSEINIRLQTKKYGIIYLEAERDHGWDMVFGPGVISYDFKGEDYIQPIETLLANHCCLFTKELRIEYNKIMPDIFQAGGFEFVFTYMCYALYLKPVVIKDLKIYHALGFDGYSYSPSASQFDFYCGLTLEDVLKNDEFKNSGMGFFDFIKMNKNLFTEEGFPLNPETIKNCIKNRFYLHPDKFDYKLIECEFIPNL